MNVLYNEWDDQAAAWIDSLIDRRAVTPGYVDTRDIEDVLPSDLKGFERVHLFAGIGTWDHALTLAGWPVGREVWTVSCPCQPFSAAGQRKGTADKRHLWPAVDWLVGQRRPHTIIGEQVASKDGRAWFDHVQADLEARGYAVGAAVTPAAGYGAPHERHRLYFAAVRLADDDDEGQQGRTRVSERPDQRAIGSDRLAGGLSDAANRDGRIRECGTETGVGSDDKRRRGLASDSAVVRLADCGRVGWERGQGVSGGCVDDRSDARRVESNYGPIGEHQVSVRPDYIPGPTNGFWRDADWLGCRDDRWRPVEPGTFPLAHGIAARVGRLRGYGNGIVLPQAIAFIESFLQGEAEWLGLRGL